jgi:tRNA threonylcarbamoyladenosine biosynthesis protein TsaE
MDSKELTYETHSAGETFALGEKLGKAAQSLDIIALVGDLGCGKTVLAQGVAAGMEVKEPVTSPTFVTVQEYHSGRLPLYHFDVYRSSELVGMMSELARTAYWVSFLEDLAFHDYIAYEGVILVEWADLLEDFLPPPYLRVEISKDLEKGSDYRRFTMRVIEDEDFSP